MLHSVQYWAWEPFWEVNSTFTVIFGPLFATISLWCFFSEMQSHFMACSTKHMLSKKFKCFFSSVHWGFSKKSSGSLRCFLAKLRLALKFFLLRGFCLRTLHAGHFCLFLMITKAGEVKEVPWMLLLGLLWTLRWFLGSFWSAGRLLLGRFTTVPCFHHFWVMALTVFTRVSKL